MNAKNLMIVTASINENEKEAYAFYTKNAGPIFKEFGGKTNSKYKITEVLKGNSITKLIITIEFEKVADIKAALNSEAYAQLLPYREKAFSLLHIFIGENLV